MPEPKRTIVRFCRTCDEPLIRKRFPSGRIETRFDYRRRAYCNFRCARLIGPEDAMFWVKVEQRGDCWIWAGVLKRGYGVFCYDVRHFAAHRWAYKALRAEIPEGLHLDHLCRTPACVNPWHLEPVTPAVNVQRGLSGSKTHCKNGHEFTPENTRHEDNASGRYRVCITCLRANQRRYHDKKRAAA